MPLCGLISVTNLSYNMICNYVIKLELPQWMYDHIKI